MSYAVKANAVQGQKGEDVELFADKDAAEEAAKVQAEKSKEGLQDIRLKRVKWDDEQGKYVIIS